MLSPDEIRTLAGTARRNGWRPAVVELLGGEPGVLQYIGDERSGDWRFLLPALPTGRALCWGGALSPVPLALAATCERVDVLCSEAEGCFLMARAEEEGFHNIFPLSSPRDETGGKYQLVAALRHPFREQHPTPMSLRTLGSLVRPGGILYRELERPLVLNPPVLIRAQLRPLGFSRVSLWWPKPTFSACEMLLPLGDRAIEHYYLHYQYFAMSPRRRLLRVVLRLAHAAGVFRFVVPEFAVLAQRTRRRAQ